MNQLKRQIGFLEKYEYNWFFKLKKIVKINKIEKTYPEQDKITFEEFRKQYPKIRDKIDEHNIVYSELAKSLEYLSDEILEFGFEKRCKKIIEKWNKELDRLKEKRMKEEGRIKSTYYTKFSESDIQTILALVIDDSDKLQESNLFYEFWKMYKTELLKVREEIVKGKILRVKEVSDKLLSISNDIKNDLEKIRDEIKEKYKLSAKELVVEGMEYI